jgi:hypothetical protein
VPYWPQRVVSGETRPVLDNYIDPLLPAARGSYLAQFTPIMLMRDKAALLLDPSS